LVFPERVEEGSLSRTLAFDCGHGYAQSEYAMKTENQKEIIGIAIVQLARLLRNAGYYVLLLFLNYFFKLTIFVRPIISTSTGTGPIFAKWL